LAKPPLRPRVGVYLILRTAQSVLLLRRVRTGFCDGLFALPSGGVEHRESLPEAAIREAWEECGLELCERDLSLVHVHQREKSKDDHRLDFFFSCTKWRGDLRNREPHKHDSLAFYPVSELPAQMIPYHMTALVSVLRQRSPDDYASMYSAEFPRTPGAVARSNSSLR